MNENIPTEEQKEEISDYWLNAFEDLANKFRSEEMRFLFGKILAGEIRKPSSFSIRTLRIISQLDNETAKLFSRLCSMSLVVANPQNGQIYDARVVSQGNAGSNSLKNYGLNFNNLNLLQEYGLIISDYHSHISYNICETTNDVTVPLDFQGGKYVFVPNEEKLKKLDTEFKLNGVCFSAAGIELIKIVEIEQTLDYHKALSDFLFNKGYEFTKLD